MKAWLGYLLIVHVTVCSKLRRAKTEKKKEFENDRFVTMFKRHALKIKPHGFCWQSLCLLH